MNKLSIERNQTATLEITDFSPGMIDNARTIIQNNDAYDTFTTNFHVMDGQNLQFPDNSFSHLGCQFGVMFFPEPKKGYTEMYRVLQKNGTAVITTWNQVDNSPLLIGFAEFLKLDDIPSMISFMNGLISIGGNPTLFQQEILEIGFSEARVDVVPQIFTFENDEVIFQAYATNAAMKKLMGGDSAVDNFSKWQEYLRTTGSKFINNEGYVELCFVANICVAVK
jgi:ubiquinone/menaquinone biosynthesis C-methylase UbiE